MTSSGVAREFTATIEQQAREIRRLRWALNGIVEVSTDALEGRMALVTAVLQVNDYATRALKGSK